MTLPIRRLKELDNATEFQPFIDADQRSARMDLAHASASNPKVTDLLNVTLSDDPNADNNLVSSFGNDDPSVTITNAPVGGVFYGTRIVTKSTSARASLCNVTLIESYPLPGRIWMNTFNPDVGTWYGWREIPTTSQNIHIDSGQLGWAEIGNDGEGGYLDLSNDNGKTHLDVLGSDVRFIKFNSSGGVEAGTHPFNHTSCANYGSQSGCSWGVTYTAPADGWILFIGYRQLSSQARFYINGIEVGTVSGNHTQATTIYPVKKGWSFSGGGGDGNCSLTFIYGL